MIASASDQDRMQPGSAVIDLYLSGLRLRAWLPMRGFKRISDMLNSGGLDFLSATLPPDAANSSSRAVALCLAAVNFVRPIEETPLAAPSRADFRQRVRIGVAMQMETCQVTGNLYLLDNVRWVDFLPAVRQRFVAVANASVSFGGGSLDPLENVFLLVNGARITALWPTDD